MSLIKSNGNKAVRSLLSDFFDSDRFFPERMFRDLSAENWTPSVNIAESDKDFSIELSAPGFKKDEFKVNVENGMLHISAESKKEEEEKGKNSTRQEFRYNSFSRSFTLPENASEEKIGAKYEDGILKLTLAKKVASEPKRKEITVG
jgi:HSP20 family protein